MAENVLLSELLLLHFYLACNYEHFLTVLLSCKDTGSGLAFDHLPHQLELILQWTKISSLEMVVLNLKMMVKSDRFFILKFNEPLQSCCCLAQKICPRRLN